MSGNVRAAETETTNFYDANIRIINGSAYDAWIATDVIGTIDVTDGNGDNDDNGDNGDNGKEN